MMNSTPGMNLSSSQTYRQPIVTPHGQVQHTHLSNSQVQNQLFQRSLQNCNNAFPYSHNNGMIRSRMNIHETDEHINMLLHNYYMEIQALEALRAETLRNIHRVSYYEQFNQNQMNPWGYQQFSMRYPNRMYQPNGEYYHANKEAYQREMSHQLPRLDGYQDNTIDSSKQQELNQPKKNSCSEIQDGEVPQQEKNSTERANTMILVKSELVGQDQKQQTQQYQGSDYVSFKQEQHFNPPTPQSLPSNTLNLFASMKKKKYFKSRMSTNQTQQNIDFLEAKVLKKVEMNQPVMSNTCNFRDIDLKKTLQNKKLSSYGDLLSYLFSFEQTDLLSRESYLLEKLFESVEQLAINGQVPCAQKKDGSGRLNKDSDKKCNDKIIIELDKTSEEEEEEEIEEDEEEDDDDEVGDEDEESLQRYLKQSQSQQTIIQIAQNKEYPLFDYKNLDDTLDNTPIKNQRSMHWRRAAKQKKINDKINSKRQQQNERYNQNNFKLEEESLNSESLENELSRKIKGNMNQFTEKSNRVLQFVEEILQQSTIYTQELSKKAIKSQSENTKAEVPAEQPSYLLDMLSQHIDISSVPSSSTRLRAQIAEILHTFKSSHKVYYKKVRSAKEMLKDTKFHNLNKRIMRVLLSILNLPGICEMKVHAAAMEFFKQMSQKLVLSAKKTIRETIVNDQYSHAHYNTMFLLIDEQNYQLLSQSQSDVMLHKLIYGVDLTKPMSVNQFAIQKSNVMKKYIYLILHKTLILNETSKDSSIEAVRSLYIERVLKGMEKMQNGKIVQRF